MKLYQNKKKSNRWGAVASVLLFAAAAAGFWFGVSETGRSTESESLRRTQEALRRAAVNCYAVEGGYPADAAYLEEHYGVAVDHDRFVVRYEWIGSNVMPDIAVVRVGNGGAENEA